MDWDDLRFVLALARERSLSAAARTLQVTHTTVSRRLKGFEEQLGIRVFDRLPDGYTPTKLGQEIVAAAERMEAEAFALDLQITGRDHSLSGTLRVGLLDTTVYFHPEVFADFTQRYPGIELQLRIGNSLHSLARREADVVLRITNKPPDHLVGRKLARIAWGLYGAPALFERAGTRDPNALPWVHWPEESGAKITEAWMRKHAPDHRIVARVDASLAMHAALEAGTGIAFIPCIYGDRSDRLERLRPPEPGFAVDLWVLTHPDLRRTGRVRAFLEHVGDAFTPLRPAFAGELPT